MINSKVFFQGLKSLKGSRSPAIPLAACFIALGALLKDAGFNIQQSAASSFSFSTSQAVVLNQLETVVRPAEGSVSQKIQELFSSLNAVAQDPSDLASRHVAADASKALVNSITTVANGISDLRTFVSQDIESNIGQANDILTQLANVQNQLLGISSSNRGPNELLDKRDALLNDLSQQ